MANGYRVITRSVRLSTFEQIKGKPNGFVDELLTTAITLKEKGFDPARQGKALVILNRVIQEQSLEIDTLKEKLSKFNKIEQLVGGTTDDNSETVLQ